MMDEISIDAVLNDSEDKLERLRNISEMFNGKINEENDVETKQTEKLDILPSSEQIKRAFRKFEINSSNDHEESDSEVDSTSEINGKSRGSSRKKSTPKEHIPYHEMAEVKDRFEKGLIDSNKIRTEKRLDIRVQNGLTSSKKQAFEQGLIEQENENEKVKTTIETELVAGLTSANKKVFEQQQQNDSSPRRKSSVVEHDLLIGAARDKKAQFENVFLKDQTKISSQPEEIFNILGTGLAQAKRDEFMSKIDGETNQRCSARPTDIDAEQGLATARRDQLAALAHSEFKPQEKETFDVTNGLATTIKQQYIAESNRSNNVLTSKLVDIESGMTKNLTTVFEKQDETFVKKNFDVESEFVERGVAKERAAMFTNLQIGSQPTVNVNSSETKLRVDRVEFSDTLVKIDVRLKIRSASLDDSSVHRLSIVSLEENGNIVRETDKREEIYFEKGQTKQLVEQWKSKQLSPDREIVDGQTLRDVELLQQGKAKNLVQMWKTIDKENSPPPSRPVPRAMTPPPDDTRRLSTSNENHSDETTNDSEEKIPIESGHAKAIRERFLQSAESGTKRSSRQITPPPLSSEEVRRKFSTTNDEMSNQVENSIFNEEFLPTKGQAKSLKNRFIELEQHAMKVETAASKIKYVPKRFVEKRAAKSKVQTTTGEEKIENEKNQYYLSADSP